MKKIKIQCPAKINLDLRVFPRDEKTGFHEIKSIMQTISLFDYVTITLKEGDSITLGGTSREIPYDEKNICYKAAKDFLEKINQNYNIDIYIENITFRQYNVHSVNVYNKGEYKRKLNWEKMYEI